jgi:hypothetical protein
MIDDFVLRLFINGLVIRLMQVMAGNGVVIVFLIFLFINWLCLLLRIIQIHDFGVFLFVHALHFLLNKHFQRFILRLKSLFLPAL